MVVLILGDEDDGFGGVLMMDFGDDEMDSGSGDDYGGEGGEIEIVVESL